MEAKQKAEPMIISLGSTYRTRAGDTVTIRDFDDYGSCYPYVGDIVTADGKHVRIASFSEAGRYVHGRETEFDIVALAASQSK